MRDARIVDQDGHGAEGGFRGLECPDHRRAVEHVGLDRDGASAVLLDPRLDGGEPVCTARHQSDRSAVCRQHVRKPQAEPARRAGNERDPAGQVEQFGGFHAALACSLPSLFTAGPIT